MLARFVHFHHLLVRHGEPLDMELYVIMAAPAKVLERCEDYLVLPQETTRDLYSELWVELGSI